MRLRKGKRVVQQEATLNGKMVGEQVEYDKRKTVCCADVIVNGREELIESTCVEEEDSGTAKEGHIEQEEICNHLEGCVGDGVVTQEERVDEIVRREVIPIEVVGGAVGCLAVGAASFTPTLGARKDRKRARLRAWKKYLKVEKAKLFNGVVNGKPDMKYNSDSERAKLAVQFLISMWNRMRTTLMDSAESLYNEVASGSTVVIQPKEVNNASKEGTDINLCPPHQQGKEEVEDNEHPRKRKRNTKSLKDSIDQSSNA